MYHYGALQIQNSGGDVTITNDGATILKQMQVLHPAARMVSHTTQMAYVTSNCAVGGTVEGSGH